MITWFLGLNPIFRKIIGGAVGLALIAGGFMYARYQSNKIKALETQVQELEKAKEIYEHDQKVDRETLDEKDKIDSLNSPDQLDDMYRMLRDRSRKNDTSE